MTPQLAPLATYISQYDEIVETTKGYVDGVKEGKSELMRPIFHPSATFFGHYPGGVMNGSIQDLYNWVDRNGPAPDIRYRFAGIEILGKIASVHLELDGLSGAIAGQGVSMSDIFTLMATDNGWTVVQKAFHWHV